MSAAKRKAKSPTWRNPREMIKGHLKRRSSRCLVSETLASSSSNLDIYTESEPPLKFSALTNRSSNPFKHSSPVKRVRKVPEKENGEVFNFESENALLEFSPGIFDSIRDSEKDVDEKRSSKTLQASRSYPIDFSSLGSFTSLSKDIGGSKTDLCERRTSKVLPLDFRLGTKLRVESLKPFPWMRDKDPLGPGNYPVRVTGTETDLGIQLFLHCSGDFGLQDECHQVTTEATSMARLEASTMYWQFPNVSWMTTFPRLDAARRYIGVKRETVPSLSSLCKDIVESMNTQWVSAFNHLFFSWKKGFRRYFYFCCSAFTVLFLKTARDSGSEIDESSCSRLSWANNSVLSVVISPTTSGFRQQLREEGINFELPLRHNSRRSSHEQGGVYFGLDNENSTLDDVTRCSVLSVTTQSQSALLSTLSSDSFKIAKPEGNGVNSESDAEQDISGDSDHATWLQDIGVSPRSTRRLTKNLSLSSFTEKSVADTAFSDSQHSLSSPFDNSKSAVVITEPASIQALFNFLNESKACHATTGPQAGLPPTLLSTEPFVYATLKSLTKFSQVLKTDRDELKYVFELSNGPIMPHMLLQLRNFIASCNCLTAPENRIKFFINGRNFCGSLNQASNFDTLDYSCLEYAVNEGLYYIS